MTIEIITPPDPRRVAARWARQYGSKWDDEPKFRKIYDALIELGDSVTRDEIDAIIGNKSWTRLQCEGCWEYVSRAVRIGNAAICPSCLRAALDIMEIKP